MIQQPIPADHDIMRSDSYIWVIRHEVHQWMKDHGLNYPGGMNDRRGDTTPPPAGQVELRFYHESQLWHLGGVMCWNDRDGHLALLFKLTWL